MCKTTENCNYLLDSIRFSNGKYCNLQNYMLEYRCFNSFFKSNDFFDKIQKIKNKEKVRKEEKTGE